MRTLILATTALVSAAAVATPALAQEVAPFTGARAGVLLGYDRLQPGSGPSSNISSANNADGLLYGGDIGYDANLGSVVIGAEGEITGSTAKVTNATTSGAIGYGRVKQGRDLYVGGRIGFLASPDTMIYAKAGYTNARLDLTANNGTTTTGNHYNLDGYRLGAGVEHHLTAATYAKIEYRYSNYGNARLTYANGATTNNFDVDSDRHQIVAGVGFRF